MGKIDGPWTDLLWKYHNKSKWGTAIVDKGFLNYFKFICDVIAYRNSESAVKNTDEFELEFKLIEKYFSSKDNIKNNIKTMEDFFDCWCGMTDYGSPADMFGEFISVQTHENGKIMGPCIDIFNDCICKNTFTLNKFILLYAFIIYLQNNKKVTKEKFIRRIRIINNLIRNSENEIRTDGNKMHTILLQTEKIILNGEIDGSIKNGFNTYQLTEEKEKIEYLAKHPEMEDTLFKLEDHPLLYGQIDIVGLDNLKDHADKFEELFKCDLDKIDCAMTVCGNYGQEESNGRLQYGSTNSNTSDYNAWKELFHHKRRKGFENTRKILIELLDKSPTFNDDILEKIANDHIKDCENNNYFPPNYYYIKYKEFRPGRYGKLYFENSEKSPYLFFVMWTKANLSENSYIPFLKAADKWHISRYDFGRILLYDNIYISCTNDSYFVYEITEKGNNKIDTITIPQTDPRFQDHKSKIDTQDRVIVLRNYIKNHGLN